MKKLLILTALLCGPLCSFGQDDGFRKLFEKYAGREGYTTVEMSGEMFRAINEVGSSDFHFHNVNRLFIIVTEEEQEANEAFAGEVKQLLDREGYTPVSVVRDGEEYVEFFALTADGKTTELVMNAREGNGEHIVLLLSGSDLRIEQILRMTR